MVTPPVPSSRPPPRPSRGSAARPPLPQGASRNVNLMTWEKLWSINKRIIDPVAPRHTAVAAERVLMRLTNGAAPAPRAADVPPPRNDPRISIIMRRGVL